MATEEWIASARDTQDQGPSTPPGALGKGSWEDRWMAKGRQEPISYEEQPRQGKRPFREDVNFGTEKLPLELGIGFIY